MQEQASSFISRLIVLGLHFSVKLSRRCSQTDKVYQCLLLTTQLLNVAMNIVVVWFLEAQSLLGILGVLISRPSMLPRSSAAWVACPWMTWWTCSQTKRS